MVCMQAGEHKTMLNEIYKLIHTDDRVPDSLITMHWTTQLFCKFGFEQEWEKEGTVMSGDPPDR